MPPFPWQQLLSLAAEQFMTSASPAICSTKQCSRMSVKPLVASTPDSNAIGKTVCVAAPAPT